VFVYGQTTIVKDDISYAIQNGSRERGKGIRVPSSSANESDKGLKGRGNGGGGVITTRERTSRFFGLLP